MIDDYSTRERGSRRRRKCRIHVGEVLKVNTILLWKEKGSSNPRNGGKNAIDVADWQTGSITSKLK
jgi:hypothetical protein